MNYKDIFETPSHNSNDKQPWYTKWSEGNIYSLILNTYIDALFVGSVFGILLSILIPITNNSIFMLLILAQPIPLIIASALYFKFVYHYKTSKSRYGLKPTFRFIILYSLIIQSIFVFIYYIT